MKILYVPLDERPCNAIYPLKAAAVSNQATILSVPQELLGLKKKAADTRKIWAFIEAQFKDCDYGVFSAEMLLYGGLLPSRLHHLTTEDLSLYQQRLIGLKQRFPEKKIFLANLIMRTPRYNSSDEEPDYYEEYGARIFRYGWLKDKKSRSDLNDEEQTELARLSSEVPVEVIADYENRRAFNVAVNILHVKLVEEGVIEFLSIPQDDSAPFGYTAIDQKKVYGAIAEKRLKEKIMVYPGADEVGFTLLARAFNQWLNKSPKIFVRYSSTLGPQLTPLYEDRPMNESLKAHIMAAGFELTEDLNAAEFVLEYNTPGDVMEESWDQLKGKDVTYDSHRHLLTFIAQIRQDLANGKKVALCDCAFANGGELELVELLDNAELLDQLLSYKAWNTNCNSLGSSLAALAFCQGDFKLQQVKQNLLANLYEDLFYQAVVRKATTDHLLHQLGLNYFDLGEQASTVGEKVVQQLEEQRDKVLVKSFLDQKMKLNQLSFPWNRMFEIYCEVK